MLLRLLHIARLLHPQHCADWANKMEALASYAMQSKNDELEKMAMRIRARAIQRCGELLKEVESAGGANLPNVGGGDAPAIGRFATAKFAGLARDQTVAALRVANVPKDELDAAIESDDPPTVTALADTS